MATIKKKKSLWATFLTGLSLAISACASTVVIVSTPGCAKFPELEPYLLEVKEQRLGQFKQIKNDPIQFSDTPIGYLPIDQAEGFVCFPAQNMADVRSWYDNHYDKIKACKF